MRLLHNSLSGTHLNYTVQWEIFLTVANITNIPTQFCSANIRPARTKLCSSNFIAISINSFDWQFEFNKISSKMNTFFECGPSKTEIGNWSVRNWTLRHFWQKNMGVPPWFYPVGTCKDKYLDDNCHENDRLCRCTLASTMLISTIAWYISVTELKFILTHGNLWKLFERIDVSVGEELR